MCRAELAWRLPPRLRRWRYVFPLDAGIGQTPHIMAKLASERSRSVLSPTATMTAPAFSVPTPSSSSRLGASSSTNGTMKQRLAGESGVETPTAEDLARLERKRKGKKLSNTDWVSKSDPEAKIAKMKDGTTHLAYKPEHAVDLDTGAVVAAELHPADEGDTTTLSKTLTKAEANLEAVDAAPTLENPAECVADKGYHSRAVLRALNDSPWKTRIAAPKQTGFSRWHGDEAARRAVTNNRARLKSGVAREAFKLRAEIVERCFAHNLDRGGMRRTWLRGRENVHKRYLLHVAGHNLSLLMRQLIGAGTPREAVAGGYGGIFVLLTPTGAMLVARGVSQSGQTAFAAAFLIWE